MKFFAFRGSLSASKSLMNRALIAQSFFSDLEIHGNSNCDDVLLLRAALQDFARGAPMNVGHAGTALRFLALRVSRQVGEFEIGGSPRLFSRPQSELIELLSQLGVGAQLFENKIVIQSQGWRPSGPVIVKAERSSQFASALVLSSWDLPFDLELNLVGDLVSEDYFKMTLKMLGDLGMQVAVSSRSLRIPRQQSPTKKAYAVELDASSLFAIVAASALDGQIEIENFFDGGLQPDFQFLSMLESMGAACTMTHPSAELGLMSLSSQRASGMHALSADFRNCPDLVPVMAVLCAFATGRSHLTGASHLAFKESDRLRKTAELLHLAGIRAEIEQGGLTVFGEGFSFAPSAFVFDPDQDHRMAMAAALFQLREPLIQILNPEVVTKSFPEFWTILQGSSEGACRFS